MADDSKPLSQLVTSTTSPQLDWYLIDTEFASMLHPVNEVLATETVHTTEAIEIFTTLLTTHLIQHGTLNDLNNSTLLQIWAAIDQEV